jgi:hypothetical protein
MKQNDGSGLKRSYDAMDDSRAIIALRIKRPRVPSDQVEASRGEDRVQERIFQSGGCAEPERDGSTYRGDCRLKFVYFFRERFWIETPECELWVRLRVISDCMTGFQDHSG